MAKIKKTYVPGKNRHRKHRNWWKYLLCILLGQILIIPEMIIGLGTVASSITNEQLFKMLGLKPEDYLSEEVSQDTILSLVAKFIGGNYKIENLGDVKQISPALENLYDEYSHFATEYGVTIDKDEFFSTNFSDFGEYALNLLMEVKLADTLTGANLDISSVPVLSELGPSILYKVPLARIELVTGGDNPTVLPDDYKIALSDDTVSFDLSDTVKFYPAETTESEIVWTSDNEGIAKINGNTVEAVSNGTATLTATPCEGVEAKTVSVEVINFTGTPTPEPEPQPEPEPETKNRPIKRDGEEKPQEGGDGEGQGEGGEEQPTAKHEGDHHFVDGHCDIELSDGTTCNELWKEARTLGEIISMFKEKQFTKMFGDATVGGLIPMELPGPLSALGNVQIASLLAGDMSFLDSLTIGDLLGGGEQTGIMAALGGISLGKLMSGDMSDLESVKISELMGGGEQTGIMAALGDITLGNIMSGDLSDVYSMTLGTLMDIDDDATGIMAALKDVTIDDLQKGKLDALYSASLGDLMDIGDDATGVMAALKDCTIDDLKDGSAIQGLKLGDVIEGVKEGDMLYPFLDYTVAELPDKFNSFYLHELLNTRTYLSTEQITAIKDNKITISEKTYDVYTEVVATDDQGGTETKYYYVTAEGIMKLLCETKVSIKGSEDFLKVTTMQEGMGELMKKATIRDILGDQDTGYIALFLDCTLDTIGTRIGQLKIGQIMPNATEGILKTLAGCYLSEIDPKHDYSEDPNPMTCADRVSMLKISDVLTIPTEGVSPVLALIKDCYLTQQYLKDANGDPLKDGEGNPVKDPGKKYVLDVINELQIKDAMGIDMESDETNGMLKAIGNCYVNNPASITAAVQTCKLGDLIKINSESSKLLQALAETPLTGIGSKIETLKISEIMDFGDNPGPILKALSGCYLTGESISDGLANLTFDDMFHDTIYGSASGSEPQGIWKLMLKDSDKSTADSPVYKDASAYSLTGGMGDLIANMTTNMVSATLYELLDAGFLGELTKADLDKKPSLTVSGYGTFPIGNKEHLGDYTLVQLINVLVPAN